MSIEASHVRPAQDDLAWPGLAGFVREQWQAFRHSPLSALLWRRLKWLLLAYFLLQVLQTAGTAGSFFIDDGDFSNVVFILVIFGTTCLTTLALLVLYYGLLFLYGTHAYQRTWEHDETLRLTALTRRERIWGITALLTMGILLASAPTFLFLVMQSFMAATPALVDLVVAGRILPATIFALASLVGLVLQIAALALSLLFTFHHVTFRLLLKEATRKRERPEGWWPVARCYITHAIYTILLYSIMGITAQMGLLIAEPEALGIWRGETGAIIIHVGLLTIAAALIYAWTGYFRRAWHKDTEKARAVLFVAEE